jgi:DNA-binding response OmpR family regulator
MCNILVIDDEAMVLEMLRVALTQFGHSVATASRGEEGLQMFEEDPFDVIITDIRLPDIDGHRVAQRVRESARPATPIIAISGTSWLVDDEEFDTVIPKPFNIKTLLGTIHDLMLKYSGGDGAVFALQS